MTAASQSGDLRGGPAAVEFEGLAEEMVVGDDVAGGDRGIAAVKNREPVGFVGNLERDKGVLSHAVVEGAECVETVANFDSAVLDPGDFPVFTGIGFVVSGTMRTIFLPIAALLGLGFYPTVLSGAEAVGAVPDSLRDRLGLSDFYQKYLDAGGFPVLSSSAVSDYALLEAGYVVDHMLAGREDIRKSLADLGYRFGIMAVTEFTTDIPEHSDLTPKDWWDRRARGLGATRQRPCVSCGEENLLKYEGDPYLAESITVHEFAHAIHEALKGIDPEFDGKLKATFEKAMAAGLWKDKYAATNRDEYWAECVQSYFGDNRENDHDHNHVNTRPELVEYDSEITALIDATFKGNAWQYLVPEKREAEERKHLAGYDPSKAPAFSWPERLREIKTARLEKDEKKDGRYDPVIRELEGWTVKVDPALLEGESKQLGDRALTLLQRRLAEIAFVLRGEQLVALRKVVIWMEKDNATGLKGMQYHPAKDWLVDNGHDPRLTKVVHIPQAAHFIEKGHQGVQPWSTLHELAHAYHDQVLGFDNAEIIAAFEAAVKDGKYADVLHIRGNRTRHYALTDHKEYFAEATEAYVGTNDFYPFVRAELKEQDPTVFAILERIWDGMFTHD